MPSVRSQFDGCMPLEILLWRHGTEVPLYSTSLCGNEQLLLACRRSGARMRTVASLSPSIAASPHPERRRGHACRRSAARPAPATCGDSHRGRQWGTTAISVFDESHEAANATGPGHFVHGTPGNQGKESGRLRHLCKQRGRADQSRLFMPCRGSKKPSLVSASFTDSAILKKFRVCAHPEPRSLCRKYLVTALLCP